MKYVKSIVVAIFIVLASVISALPAKPVAAIGSSSMSIAPRKNYTISPGQSDKDTLVIRNLDTVNELDLNLRVVDFTYTGDDGTPKLLIGTNIAQTTWSLKPFLTIPESTTIAAGATKTLDMKVAVPSNQGAGSYYSAIMYSTGAPDGGNVGLAASGVTLVFVSVPGKVNESLTLQNFGAYLTSSQTSNPGYVFMTADKPLAIGYTLKNAGNVTEAPAGSISMKYMFGSSQNLASINPNQSLALIGQTRTFTACIKQQAQSVSLQGAQAESTVCIPPDIWPGFYSLSLDVFYGQNGNLTREITGIGSFWYLPWWFVITFIVVLLIVAFFVWRLVKKIQTALYGPKRTQSRRR